MKLKQTFANPFYFLLMVAGTVFSLTACVYGVMTVRALRGVPAEVVTPGGRLMDWIDQNGVTVMVIELALLAVFCFLAMWTDSYWDARADKKSHADTKTTTVDHE